MIGDILGSIFGAFNTDQWFPQTMMGTGRKTTSGVRVGPASALSLPAYFGCIQVIAQDVAKLPLKVYREGANNTKTIVTDHPASRILRRRPNGEMTSFTMRETLLQWAAGWGNGYAEIVRDNAGQLQELSLIHPSRVTIRRADGKIVYDVRSEVAGLEVVRLLSDEVFHVHGMGDGLAGWSVAQVGAQSIGAAMAAETFAAAYYGNNASVGGVLKHPGQLKPEARKNLRESWQEMHGGPDNAHKVAILEEGVEFSPTSVNPRDAQFIEGRQFDVESICRWFRMPPHKIQHLLRATFTNIESQGIEYVTDTLMSWIVRFEQECERKLLGEDETLCVKHDVNSLMRGDAAARGAFYSQLFQVGVLSANEIRQMEDMEPSTDPASKKYFVQGALVPIGDAGKQLAKPTTVSVEQGKPVETPPAKPPGAESPPVMVNLNVLGNRSYQVFRDPKTNYISRFEVQEHKS